MLFNDQAYICIEKFLIMSVSNQRKHDTYEKIMVDSPKPQVAFAYVKEN